jgi:hypothetical protein
VPPFQSFFSINMIVSLRGSFWTCKYWFVFFCYLYSVSCRRAAILWWTAMIFQGFGRVEILRGKGLSLDNRQQSYLTQCARVQLQDSTYTFLGVAASNERFIYLFRKVGLRSSGCIEVYFENLLTFRRHIQPLSSRSKSKTSKKPERSRKL